MNKQKDALKENKQLKINVCVVCMHCALQEGNNDLLQIARCKTQTFNYGPTFANLKS